MSAILTTREVTDTIVVASEFRPVRRARGMVQEGEEVCFYQDGEPTEVLTVALKTPSYTVDSSGELTDTGRFLYELYNPVTNEYVGTCPLTHPEWIVMTQV